MFAKNRKIRKVSDFSKASYQRDIGLISFSETVSEAKKEGKQTRVTVLDRVALYELYQTLSAWE